MTGPLRVADIVSYLAETGWEREPHDWRGASTWQHPGEYELLVPGRDGLGDGDRRVREILHCLSALENRPPDDIALEISRPQLDRQFFKTFPDHHDAGYTSLPSGVQALQGIRGALAASARTALQGPHYAFGGRPPNAVAILLRGAELGPSRAGSYIVETRLATDLTAQAPGGTEVRGRVVMVQMLEAMSAAQAALFADVPAAFDETVTAGVSSDLCRSLSELSGTRRDEPFEITFRWARSQPLDSPSHTVAFPETAGPLLQAAAERLRGLHASGPALVTGVIEGLYDDAAGGDRWRIQVRGQLRTEHTDRSRRGVWIRLTGQDAYDRAIIAHRQRREITVAGELSSATGRVELVPTSKFEL